MADEPENPEETAEDAPKKSKKGLFLVGGVMLLMLVGYLGASMGVPSEEPIPQLEGPFVIGLNEADKNMQINLASTDQTVYLLISLSAEFDAYEAGELEGRMTDPRYRTYLMDALVSLCSEKTPESLEGRDSKDAFKLEVLDAIDPILFPVKFGDAAEPLAADPNSGLRPGISTFNASLRGRYYDHKLTLDVPNKTIRLDDGEELTFIGDEDDLAVSNASGKFVFVNLTMLDPEFVGEVKVGVTGRIRRILSEFWVKQ